MADEQFGPYRLEMLIGAGGMGEVYRAFDTVKERVVALKRLPAALAADTEFQARFCRESRLTARLREPHVIPIHDYGEIDGQLFIDMRLVEGIDLASLIAQQGRLEPSRAVHIVAQVASALDAAHADGLVHRDVKPSNVLISGTERGDDYVYLVDFGIARSTASETQLTGTGNTIGTLDYMAPERFAHSGVDPRVDVYALSCVLYEALTARTPFRGDEPLAKMYAHVNVPPPAPSREVPGIPTGLDAVVARGMAKDPDQRYAGAGDLAVAARAALSSTMRATSAPDLAPAALVLGPPQGATLPQRPPPQEPTLPQKPPTLEQDPAPQQSLPPPVPTAAVLTVPAMAWTRSPPHRQVDTAPPHARFRRRRTRRRALLLAATGLIVLAATVTTVVLFPQQPQPQDSPVSSRDLTPKPGPAIPVGERPESVAVASEVGRVYVTNSGAGTLSVIDTRSDTVDATIEVGAEPGGVALSGDRVYVANYGDSTVSVINIASESVVATIPVEDNPDRVAASPDGSRIYVTSDRASMVSMIDTGSNDVIDTIPVGTDPFDVEVSRDGSRIYVTDFEDATVMVIDTSNSAVVATIPVGARPQDCAVSPDGSRLYVPNFDDGTVTVIDTGSNSVVGTISVGAEPQGVAVSPDGHRLYVVNEVPGTLSVIDADTNIVTGTIPIGDGPLDVAVAQDGTRAYVPVGGADTLLLVDFVESP